MRRKCDFTERLNAYTLTRLHALTLIELVIVCAIIAILVGIVWVVMAPVREKVRQTVCISNLTQIGHAFRMYRDDWDGIEPQKGVQLEYWQLGLPPEKPPINALASYIKSAQVWFCPSWFLPPWEKQPVTYTVSYCTHRDVEFRDPYLPYYEYDECPLLPCCLISFKRLVAYVPNWPIVICINHHFYYDPKFEWLDMRVFTINLPDYDVHKSWFSEYLIQIPRYIMRIP